MKSFISLHSTVALLKRIKEEYGIEEVDIGALEPFLYRDGDFDIVDLISAIEDLSLKVKITTNGSLLYRYIDRLKSTNIKKVRISLHTLDKSIFTMISNSDNFSNVIESIRKAKEANLPIEINSIIFKGYEKYIVDIIEFCLEYKINLKLYNLYYSPFYKKEYEQYYISAEEIISFIKKHYIEYEIVEEQNDSKRNRVILKIKNVEFVIKDDYFIDRDNIYCQNCQYVDDCGEQFAEYIRVDPDLYFYPCYLRKDLRFNLQDEDILCNLYNFNKKINIRLIVSAVCNFKCSFPDDGKTFWCLKQGGDYKWQGIRY